MDSASDSKNSPTRPSARSNPTSRSSEATPRPYLGILQPEGFPGLPDGWTTEALTDDSVSGEGKIFAAFHRASREGSGAHPAPHRVLVVAHGMGEHGGRYLHFPHFLKDVVGGVYCPDHLGHGRSEGLRGHAGKFDYFADDLAGALVRLDERLKAEHGRSEIHLLGHSMGGLVVLRTLFRHTSLPIKSVTLSSPLLGIKVAVPIGKRIAAPILGKLWGSLQLENGVDATRLTHDPEVARAYVADRLVHKKTTPRLYLEILAAMADVNARDSGIEQPLMMIVAGQDEIVDSEASLKFFRTLKHRDKLLKTYPQFFHESFNEVGKEQAFEDLKAWLLQNKA